MVLAIRTRGSAPSATTPEAAVAACPAQRGKPSNKAEQRQAKGSSAQAPVGRFTSLYGTNFASLEPWVRLCRDLGVEGPLHSKTACKKVRHTSPDGNTRPRPPFSPLPLPSSPNTQLPRLKTAQHPQALKGVHVNIRDFLDAVDARARHAAAQRDAAARAAILAAPVHVRFFDSEWCLSAYTISNRRVYPKKEMRANSDHPLRLLMAHIISPGGSKARRGAIGC